MITTRAAQTRPGRVLAVLFAGAFVMGCAEMLVVGMIDLIAADLAVSVPAAGALVTANALGLALGGPLLTFLTTRFDRRHVLIGATAVFVAANLLPALVADYPLFVAARVVIGAVQGLFIAAAMVDRHLDRAARAHRPRDGRDHLGIRHVERVGAPAGHAARPGRRMARLVRGRRRGRRRRAGARDRRAAVGADRPRQRRRGPGAARVRAPGARGAGGELPDLRGHAVGDHVPRAVPDRGDGCLGADRARVPARLRRRHRDRLVRRRPIRRHERLRAP